MNGLHLLADLHGCSCRPEFLLAVAELEAYCVAICRRHGLTVMGHFFHQFTNPRGRPAGVTGAVVLAESHLAIHTWPEIAAVTLDIYVCNFNADNSNKARTLLAEAVAAFAPKRMEQREVERGRLQP